MKRKLESRVTAPNMYLYVNGKWKYRSILNRGHRVIEVSFTDPARQPIATRNRLSITLGTQTRQITVLHKPGTQISGLKGMDICCAEDFDAIWEYFSVRHPTLVNLEKPLTVLSMTTINKHGVTCVWRRKDVGKKGANRIYKLMLWTVNGKQSADIELSKQIKHAGKMYVDVCDIKPYTVHASACRKAISSEAA